MKVDLRLVPTIKDGIKKRKEESDSEYLHGAERIELSHVEDLRFDASKKDFRFVVDEPTERGGTDKGPNPLAYFLAGAASCLMMQYARLIIADSLKIDKLCAVAIARFDRRIGGRFHEIIYEIWIEGQENEDVIRALSQSAEGLCIASNTLKANVETKCNIIYNGSSLR